MSELTKFTIAQLQKKLAAKECSAVEVTKAYLKRAVDLNATLNAYVTFCEDEALAKAAQADQDLAAGKAAPLAGIPIGVKDLYCTKNIKTTACSKILENFVPPYESTVTENLWAAGALPLGKINMDEFAMGSTNLYSAFGPVINPLKRSDDDAQLVPGGSSGGSAAAVAADLCAAALGSDTGGSIRQPAAFNGIVGIKPTYGRCSRWGMIAYASSLDQAGPLTKDVTDAALILNAICGYDAKDSTSAQIDVPDFTADLNKGVAGLKIGIPKSYQMDGMEPAILESWENAAKLLEKQGAELVEVELPLTHYGAPAYYIISTAEASANLARYDGVKYGLRVHEQGDSLDDMYAKTRAVGFGEEVKSRIMVGTYVLSSGYYDAYYKKAQKVRRLIAEDFDKAFKQVDLLLTPTTPNAAFGVNDKLSTIELYYNDIFTVPANLAGLPALSLPAGLNKDNLPLGVQIMAPRFAETKIFQAARHLEREIAFDHSKLNYRV